MMVYDESDRQRKGVKMIGKSSQDITVFVVLLLSQHLSDHIDLSFLMSSNHFVKWNLKSLKATFFIKRCLLVDFHQTGSEQNE